MHKKGPKEWMALGPGEWLNGNEPCANLYRIKFFNEHSFSIRHCISKCSAIFSLR